MTRRFYGGCALALVLALVAAACGSTNGPTTVPGASGGTTQSVADLPPSNPNVDLSCPHDAPTQLSVLVDDFVADKGGWKVLIEFRPTSSRISRYVVWYTRRGDPEKSFSIDGRPSVTVYLPLAGIYAFQVTGSCNGDTAGFVRSVQVVKGVGAEVFGPDVPVVPVPVPPPPSK